MAHGPSCAWDQQVVWLRPGLGRQQACSAVPPSCLCTLCTPLCPLYASAQQAKRQAQLEHLVAAKRLEDRVAGILARVERELDDAGALGGVRWESSSCGCGMAGALAGCRWVGHAQPPHCCMPDKKPSCGMHCMVA